MIRHIWEWLTQTEPGKESGGNGNGVKKELQHNAEERADRTLDFARTELARYERELDLASGGRHRAKRKRD